MFKHHLHQG